MTSSSSSSPRPLTGRQAELLGFICAHLREKGYAPTLRELGALMSIRSTNGVNDHLMALERKGYIRRDDMLSRAIIVLRNATGEDETLSAGQTHPPPVATALPYIPLYTSMEPLVVAREIRRPSCAPTAAFAVVMRGEMLSGAGVCSGDWLFVDDTGTAMPGKLVVVRVAEMVMVRYFAPDGGSGMVRLLTNDVGTRTPPLVLRSEDFRRGLAGVVCGLYRPQGAGAQLAAAG